MLRRIFAPLIITAIAAIILAAGGMYLVSRSPSPAEPPPPPAAPPPDDLELVPPPESALPPPPPSAKACIVTGCSGEICADAPVVTTCIFKPEYTCYKNARCERQSDGSCGWTLTPELFSCLERERRGATPPLLEPPPPPPPPAAPPPPQPAAAPGVSAVTLEADDRGFYPSHLITVPGGTLVKLTFAVRTENVYFGGLDFRSKKFNTPAVMPGGSITVEFSADESFEFKSYWPASGVLKATGKVVVE